jgi:murein DD-endopeptidase MepM/ murein hydrolase activator NlpD
MWLLRTSIPLALSACTLSAGSTSALAMKDTPGGVSAPATQPAVVGGAGSQPRSAPSARPAAEHPTLSELAIARSPKPGPPPALTLAVQDAAGSSVDLQVAIESRSSTHAAVLAKLGWVLPGRTLTVAWPRGARLAAGTYRLLVSGRDRRGQSLERGARTALEAEVVVKAQAPKPSAPAPSASAGGSGSSGSSSSSSSASTVSPAAGVPSPAQSAAEGAVFPVAGEHNFGGPENAFGAPRSGYSHQGQDILTAEGTPDVAPYAGEIESTSYQEGGAGYYAVERTSVGFSFFFAHCQAGSLAVSGGQSVSAGELICRAGQTGDATTPHLDFEIWIDGWRTAEGYPINPLPYLEAWEHDSASA